MPIEIHPAPAQPDIATKDNLPFKEGMQPNERRLAELKHVAYVALDQESRKLDSQPKVEENKRLAAAELQTIRGIQEISVGDHKTKKDENGIDCRHDNKPQFTVAVSGQEKGVLFITSADEKYFECVLEEVSSPQKISRVVFIDSYFKAKSDIIAQYFPEGSTQRTALEMYSSFLKDGEGSPNLQDTDKVDNTIKEAASAADISTTDDVKAFVEKQFPEAANDPKKGELLKLLGKSNILTFEQFMAVARAAGLDTDTSALLADIIQQENSIAQALTMNPDLTPQQRSSLTRQLNDLKKAHALSEHAQKLMEGKSEPEIEAQFKEIFNAVQGGKDPEKAKAMKEALRTGDATAILAALFPAPKDESPEDKAKREKLIKILGKLKTGGGALALILYWFTEQATQGLISGK